MVASGLFVELEAKPVVTLPKNDSKPDLSGRRSRLATGGFSQLR
jgi:hypothetical protein